MTNRDEDDGRRRTVFKDYAPHQHAPLTGYLAAMVCFCVGFSTLLRRLPGRSVDRLRMSDIVLLGVGTHKLSRIVAKDFVTAPIRAPFTQRGEAEGGGEVHDEPRGGEAQRTLGSLLSCPYCLGPWLAAGLGTSLALKPRPTRFALAALSAVTISDFLHQGYARMNENRKLVQARRKQVQHDEATAGRGA
jgi:hypothetical protein